MKYNYPQLARRSGFKSYRDLVFCRLFIAGMTLLLGQAAGVGNSYYVRPPGTTTNAISPYDSWETAATQIQWAVNIAMTNLPATVWVTNGEYFLTNEISITNSITVRSVNGATNTIVNGNYPTTTNTCFNINIAATNATLDGFTIINGCNNLFRYPGGVYIGAGVVQNCIITGNRATNGYGGGAGLLSGATLQNCTISNNYCVSDGYGGGVYMGGGLVQNCVITGNSGPSAGGGIYTGGGTAQYCTITGNWVTNAAGTGGGASIANANATVQYCVISSNRAASGGGATINDATLRNCLIVSNVATSASANKGGGGLYMAGAGTIQNCTIVSNSAPNKDGGGILLYGGGAVFQNTIIYFNTSSSSTSNYYDRGGLTGVGSSFSNCCFAPALTYAVSIAISSNNITSDPIFIGFTSNDYRLDGGSPCINAGVNKEWMALDLDRRHRIDIFSGIVDMGCYEYMPRGTISMIR